MTISVEKFLMFLNTMYNANLKAEACEFFLSSQRDGDSIVIPETAKHFMVFGHIEDPASLHNALVNQPLEMVFDGSIPITLTSSMTNYGHYDDVISPILERTIHKMNQKLPQRSWTVTLRFESMGSLTKCSISGRMFVSSVGQFGVVNAGDKEINGVTFGPSVHHCIEYAEEILPQLI